MKTINLIPLICFLKEKGFKIINEDENSFELLKSELMGKVGILEIPKKTSNELVFKGIFNTIANILLENNLVNDFEIKLIEKEILD